MTPSTAHRARPAPHDHRKMHEAVWTREDARAILDDPARNVSENPRTLWKRSGLAKGMRVVDVGAGSGFFAFPASDIVGPSGRVYAVDLSPELVQMVRERARAEHRDNLEAVACERNHIPLLDGLADRVLLANVLHGIAPPTVREAVRVLRPGGRLVDMDWKKEPTPRGPPVEHRLSVREARRTLARYALRPVADWVAGPYHYAVMLEKEAVPGRPVATSPKQSPPRARPR